MKQASGKLNSLIEPAVSMLGYELLGVEHLAQGRHSLLRIYIDHPNSITVEDCEQVSRQVSAVLDVEDPVKGQYTLEVSSPGLDRPLFKLTHFERFIGQEVSLTLAVPVDGRRKLKGRITAVEDDKVKITEGDQLFLLTLEQIDRARLIPDLDFK